MSGEGESIIGSGGCGLGGFGFLFFFFFSISPSFFFSALISSSSFYPFLFLLTQKGRSTWGMRSKIRHGKEEETRNLK